MRDFHLPGRSPVFSTNGLCATSHPLAAKTAVNILERGGNAMDAAAATKSSTAVMRRRVVGFTGGDGLNAKG